MFKEELELKQHMAREHGDELGMSRAQRREALTLPLQFSVSGGTARVWQCYCGGGWDAALLQLCCVHVCCCRCMRQPGAWQVWPGLPGCLPVLLAVQLCHLYKASAMLCWSVVEL